MLFFFATLFAQEPIRYTTKQGLPSNHIYDIQQDSDGFMWFATNRGVVKFDGTTFKTFNLKDGLPNNDTWLLEPDSYGKMWYFSKSKDQGFISKDSVYTYCIPNANVISPILLGKSTERLWFHGAGNLYSIDVNNTKLQVDSLYADFYNGLLDQRIEFDEVADRFVYHPELSQFILFRDNFISFYSKDFELLDKINFESSYFLKKSPILKSGVVLNQYVYCSSYEDIVVVNMNTREVKQYSYKELINKKEISTIRVNKLANEIQITVPGHLIIFDNNFELKKAYSFSERFPSKNSYKDKDGNIWLSDLSQGIAFIPNSHLQSSYFLRGKKIQKMGVVNNALFIGVREDGYYEYDSSLNDFYKRTDILAKDNIYQIKEGAKKNESYFVSGYFSMILIGNDISRFQLKNIEDYNSNKAQFGFKDIIQFKNAVYGITSQSVLKHDTKSLKNTISIIKAGLSQSEIFKDRLFFSGSDGLFSMVKDSLVRPEVHDEITKIPVTSMLSSDAYLLVGTDGRGVYMYNEEEIIHLKNTEDLSVQKIIQQDSILWLATQQGVKKVALDRNHLANSLIVDAFYEADGLLQDNTNAIYVSENKLYAASDIGLAQLDLNDSIYKKQPELFFKTKGDTLVFKNEDRDNIAVSFASLSYKDQTHINYSYRLLPDQKEWLETDTKTLNFSNLSPNFYTLEVRAIDHHQNVSVKSIYLKVIPMWWQTIWAKVVFVILFIGFIFLLLKMIQKRIRRSEAKKAERDKRVAGLELQALRSQMNPHFVHNSLNAIQYYIQRNEVEQSENYLVKFSKLIRMFFEYSRKQNITIAEEVSLLTNYLEIEKLRFEEKLTYKIHLDEKIEEEQLIPSMILQPIVENAVNHGLFHKKENGTVVIHFSYIDVNKFQVIIEDDGIGIKRAKEIYSSSSKNYQSRSSEVLQERLELLKQSDDWDITFDIQDISDLPESQSTKNTGTIVTLIYTQMDLA